MIGKNNTSHLMCCGSSFLLPSPVKTVVKKSRESGYIWGSSTGGNPWSLLLDNNQKLRKIKIDHKDWIYSIIFTTQDFSGLLQSSKQHGGASSYRGGKISEINFDVDEKLIGINGTVGVTTGCHEGFKVISSLFFFTNKKTDGAFGKPTGTSFSVPWDAGSFAGFYGRGGLYIDGCSLIQGMCSVIVHIIKIHRFKVYCY
ncbi:jacalin-like lectin domain-containing protein [Artemisia annua]|uniref:Jacalin-like lectin domain-containing protein n=1 Tax=Artemisia annua TaxID=35608 RepID=A0A2U1Q5B5_ARTAN|nr:jacalin-like lectin domain-containing protein [Artemisia annua]